MKEVLTYHFPLKRDSVTPPEMTLVVRRAANDEWQAGISVCSNTDQFVKLIGRARAAAKMRRSPFTAKDPSELISAIATHLAQLNNNRPETVSNKTFYDLQFMVKPLAKMEVV